MRLFVFGCILLCVSMLVLFVDGCSSGTDKNENTSSGNTMTIDPDSLRKAYTQRIQSRSNPLPVNFIREPGKLFPVDEAPQDTVFFVFRESFLDAVSQKDIFFLLEHVDENIKCGFEGEDGIANLVKIWKLDSEAGIQSSGIWDVLRNILQQGGTFEENRQRFVAPYVFSTFPDNYDGTTYGAITGAGVRMRAAAGLNSTVLKIVTHDIVQLLEQLDQTETIDGETFPWVKIRTLDGTEGFIWGKFVASPVGFRAGFDKQPGGNWKMTFLVAGD